MCGCQAWPWPPQQRLPKPIQPWFPKSTGPADPVLCSVEAKSWQNFLLHFECKLSASRQMKIPILGAIHHIRHTSTYPICDAGTKPRELWTIGWSIMIHSKDSQWSTMIVYEHLWSSMIHYMFYMAIKQLRYSFGLNSNLSPALSSEPDPAGDDQARHARHARHGHGHLSCAATLKWLPGTKPHLGWENAGSLWEWWDDWDGGLRLNSSCLSWISRGYICYIVRSFSAALISSQVAETEKPWCLVSAHHSHWPLADLNHAISCLSPMSMHGPSSKLRSNK